MIDYSHVLPVPGPLWGPYPLRAADDRAPPWRRPQWRGTLAQCRQVVHAVPAHAEAWRRLALAERPAVLQALRRRLRRSGLRPDALAQALAVVSACAAEMIGWTPRQNQHLAAAALLQGRMVEMATGEGKTLAIGLAAATAALAGLPVHVVTANDYLAQRDAARLAPLFAMLGLHAAALAGATSDDAKRAVYAHDIVYATAKDLAFDFLRDRQAAAPEQGFERVACGLGGQGGKGTAPPPLLRGLCMALLDEADSILLDEAEVPLILSRAAPQAARRAFLWQALALARQLGDGRDFVLHRAERIATLTPTGEQRLAALADCLGGPWRRPRYRREAVLVALAGLHACRRDEHYVVVEGRIDLLDEVSGRAAVGRVWSRGLHTVVALKEGLSPPPETETVSQITFQRFFQRYWRLSGISGTLCEARGELREVYGAAVVCIPLHRPCRRRDLPARRFDTAEARFDAAVERITALQAAGRPVLVGTDSVADSQQLSERLQRCGVMHRVLNALQHADEANIIAEAGQAGRVTVATRMAGRGTDIELDASARAAGGLHVLSCQDNPSRRLDRQLCGRAGRQGDPGSSEAWSLRHRLPSVNRPGADTEELWNNFLHVDSGPWLAVLCLRWAQWREERRRATVRRSLLEQDLHWEGRLSFAGRPQ